MHRYQIILISFYYHIFCQSWSIRVWSLLLSWPTGRPAQKWITSLTEQTLSKMALPRWKYIHSMMLCIWNTMAALCRNIWDIDGLKQMSLSLTITFDRLFCWKKNELSIYVSFISHSSPTIDWSLLSEENEWGATKTPFTGQKVGQYGKPYV